MPLDSVAGNYNLFLDQYSHTTVSLDPRKAQECPLPKYSGTFSGGHGDGRGLQSTFPQKKNLFYLKTCCECTAKRAKRRDDKRTQAEPPSTAEKKRSGPAVQPTEGHATLQWNECVALLESHKNVSFELETFISMAGDSVATAFGGHESGKAVSDAISQQIWNRWYTPAQWPLWARASCDAIPRLKTTMVVESMWKHLKCRDLAQFNHPRLDLVTHLVLTSLLPRVDAKAEWVDKSRSDKHRRVAKELQVLKSPPGTKGWAERLEQLADDETWESGTYATDIQKWVCPCKSYSINRFLMCKHLIREANKLLDNRPLTKLRFFLDLRWNHFPPYYSIPGIHAATEPDDADEAEPKVPIFLGIRGAGLETREQEEEQASMPRKTADTPPRPEMTLAGGNKGDPEAQLIEEENPPAARVKESAGTEASVSISFNGSDDDIDESQPSDRDNHVQFSDARKIHLKRCWEDMMGVLDNPRGVHPKMAAILEGAFGKIERIGGDIGKDKRRRTNPRTWDDLSR
ncbi:hypothetical protein FB451DRAFT_1465249 [Mycena latifolia]|nr:hypothetical protein FB451DRAFT_1465249 [Mycena latifolia]